MINEGNYYMHCIVWFAPQALGKLVKCSSWDFTSLNIGDWGRAQESAFSSGFLSSSLKGGLKTVLGTIALEGVNLTERPSKS